MERVYLNVPYAEKDRAKSLGARWDAQAKCWYIGAHIDRSLFKVWLPEATERAAKGRTEYSIVSEDAYVATTISICWKCSDPTDVICIYCALATIDGDHYRHLNCSNVTAMDAALEEQMKAYQRFRLAYSKTANDHYFANHCRWCDALQGDFFDHNEPGGAFFPQHESDYGLYGFQPLAGIVRFDGGYGSGVMEEVFKVRGGHLYPDIWETFCERAAWR